MKNLVPIKMACILCFSMTADTGHFFDDMEVPQNTGALGHSSFESEQDKSTGMSITSLDVEN